MRKVGLLVGALAILATATPSRTTAAESCTPEHCQVSYYERCESACFGDPPNYFDKWQYKKMECDEGWEECEFDRLHQYLGCDRCLPI